MNELIYSSTTATIIFELNSLWKTQIYFAFRNPTAQSSFTLYRKKQPGHASK